MVEFEFRGGQWCLDIGNSVQKGVYVFKETFQVARHGAI